MVSPQMSHAIRQLGLMLLAAMLAAFVNDQTNILNSLMVPEVYQPIVIAGVGAAVRVVEGWRDRLRQEEGKVIQSDVAFDIAENLADPTVAVFPTAVQPDNKTVYVDVLPPSGVIREWDSDELPKLNAASVPDSRYVDTSGQEFEELIATTPEFHVGPQQPPNPGYTVPDKASLGTSDKFNE